MTIPYLSLLVALPLAGALLLGFTGIRARGAALLVSGAELLLAVATLWAMDPAAAHFQLSQEAPWIASLGIHYRVGVDTLSAIFLPFTALLFVGVVAGSWRQKTMPSLYFSLLLMLEGATMGVFVALDTLLFFLFWELTLIPIFLLITLFGIGPHRRQAAIQYTLIMIAGGIPLLWGLLLTAFSYPHPRFDLPSLLANPLPSSVQTGVFWLLLVGFGIKTPMIPLHTWLPTVAMEGPVAVTAVMTGLKLGAYGLLRFAIPLAPEAAQQLHWLLAGLGVASIVYGGLVALVQTNLRRMLAYASISHVGLVVLGLASFSLQGIQGALYQLLIFSLVSGGLYGLVGALHQRFGSTDLIHLGGLARAMPLASTLFLLLGLGGLGLPLTAGFPAEQLLLFSTLATHRGAGLAALGGSILGAAYFLGAYRQAFLGPPRHQDLERGPDLLPHEGIIPGVMAALLVAGGIFPMVIPNFTQAAAQAWVNALSLP